MRRKALTIITAGLLGLGLAETASAGAECGGMPVAAGRVGRDIGVQPHGGRPVVAFAGAQEGRGPVAVVLDGIVLPASADSIRPSLADRLSRFAGAGIVVHGRGIRTDRRGRIAGQVAVSTAGGPVWLQGLLVREGLAYVGDRAGSCAEALLALEAEARESRRGLFAEAAVRSGGPLELPDFVVLDGRVVSVGNTASTTYLNFGRDISTDATVRISRRTSADFPAEKEPKRLAGARVRVRGWAFERDGIDLPLAGPDAIEIIEEQRQAR